MTIRTCRLSVKHTHNPGLFLVSLSKNPDNTSFEALAGLLIILLP